MYSSEASIYVPNSPDITWEVASDFQNFDAFMSHIKAVIKLDDRLSQWRLAGPLGIPVSWKAVTTIREPPRKLAWEAVEGPIKTNGVITIEPEGRGSRIAVKLRYMPPAGALGEVFARLFKNPQKMLEQDLEKLRDLIGENSEARSEDRQDNYQ